MNNLMQAALLSLLPFTELRLSIPLAIALGENSFYVFLACTLANILVIPIVFIFLNFMHSRLMNSKTYSEAFGLLLKDKTQKRKHEGEN